MNLAYDPGELEAIRAHVVGQTLLELPAQTAIGLACAVLLHYAVEQPDMVRTVLHEPVVRDGFRGKSLLKTLTRT
jgi:hypothetical protein